MPLGSVAKIKNISLPCWQQFFGLETSHYLHSVMRVKVRSVNFGMTCSDLSCIIRCNIPQAIISAVGNAARLLQCSREQLLGALSNISCDSVEVG